MKTNEVQILETSVTKYSTHLKLACGKVSAVVSVASHGLQVCCLNASNRAWGGSGRHYPSTDAALANFKSAEMKAIIQAAVNFVFIPTATNFAA